LAPLFVDSGATKLQLSFFLFPSSPAPSLTPIFSFWKTLPLASFPFVPSFLIVPNNYPFPSF